MFSTREHAACGVGFVVQLQSNSDDFGSDYVGSREVLDMALNALCCVEHRGACGADLVTGDGAGVMTEIPYEVLGLPRNKVAVATLYLPQDEQTRRRALLIFEQTIEFLGLQLQGYRVVPTNIAALGSQAARTVPVILQAFIPRPAFANTDASFNRLLYQAKRIARTKQNAAGLEGEFFFVSLSTSTVIYKALTKAEALADFYPDLRHPAYRTRFALFHRRFSTNTSTGWDKAQPFSLIAHNGEINTISGNRSWGVIRERAMGLPDGELLTHDNISDSGSFNEMAEALLYRSGIPYIEDALAIMVPPANNPSSFYKLWGRAMEPWDGPAFLAYCDGDTIGARLDRNGFRPCRWLITDRYFCLGSEDGIFTIKNEDVIQKGALHAGTGVCLHFDTVNSKIDGKIETKAESRTAEGHRAGGHKSDSYTTDIYWTDPSVTPEYAGAHFDERIQTLTIESTEQEEDVTLERLHVFGYSLEDTQAVLLPMIEEGKEPIGSMGDTASLAVLSTNPRPLFDYFYQRFAQVTNPPVDYLREQIVTNLTSYIGRKPNIFNTKELIPLFPAIRLDSPVLTLEQMAALRKMTSTSPSRHAISSVELDLTFPRNRGVTGFRDSVSDVIAMSRAAVEEGHTVLILSDRKASYDRPPLPTLLVLSAINSDLVARGVRMRMSLVVDTGEVRATHHLATLLGFGAAAVCPYLAYHYASCSEERSIAHLDSAERMANVQKSLQHGLLKIMSKMGISVFRSYQGSKLFSVLGLGREILESYFPGFASPIGGIGIEKLVNDILFSCQLPKEGESVERSLPRTYLFKDHNKNELGERHSMTVQQTKLLHDVVRSGDETILGASYQAYLAKTPSRGPVSVRHLLALNYVKADGHVASGLALPISSPISSLGASPTASAATSASTAVDTSMVESRSEILRKFGSGAMSFGAISAESQRDIILAMRSIGGRSNSGEGGENPYYWTDGITTSVKQVASGRFGVTAQYLATAGEIQIKIAQGAKPGEGGQLMRAKVDEHIARARHAKPGIDLISPPPMHDIYSIEDLRELIFELRQVNPKARISVKLVSGEGIGTIAVGVAKAGADVIHIAGHDGGTGAASRSSMRHAGLPWEIGLIETHLALIENQLRDSVVLRTDGGLSTGADIVKAAIFGAQEFDFGKLLLIAEGCVMARICEKNTCPTGIATHDARFKAKYKGDAKHVVRLLENVAEETREHLAKLGLRSLEEAVGRKELLKLDPRHVQLVAERGVELNPLLAGLQHHEVASHDNLYREAESDLNAQIVADVELALKSGEMRRFVFDISSKDRAVLATLSGRLAQARHFELLRSLGKPLEQAEIDAVELYGALGVGHGGEGGDIGALDCRDGGCAASKLEFEFTGYAGQGFAAFATAPLEVRLNGGANDSVCKGISGGKVVIRPAKDAVFALDKSSIVGNSALYGATGGVVYIAGLAGDRFAVRNSGAQAVVEGVGFHACEYMTAGVVVILGEFGQNVGAGMTGGTLFVYMGGGMGQGAHLSGDHAANFNPNYFNMSYLQKSEVLEEDFVYLRGLLADYLGETSSGVAKGIIENWDEERRKFAKFVSK